MRKQSIDLQEPSAAHPTSRLPQRVVAVLLSAVSLPIAYEGLQLWVASWKSAMGRSVDVRTPVMDLSRDVLNRLSDEIARTILPSFQHVPWQPSHVLFAAGLAMTLSMLMLRR